MKLLFAHSFFMALDPKQRQLQAPYPPLGTIIAASQAREAGFDVALFDAMLADAPADLVDMMQQTEFDAVIFFEDNFNWLSKMCLDEMRLACFEMIGSVKQMGKTAVVAGSDASDFPQLYLRSGADYVIKGEAEFRLLDLLQTGQPGPGVFYLQDEQLCGMNPIKPEKDLSRFASPAWDLVDITAYRRLWQKKHGYFSLNMMTTRGCPYGCNWCAKPIHGRRYDMRHPADVAQELLALKQQFQPDEIWFTDDIFGLKPDWIQQFASEVNQRDAQIPFKIQARADLMTEKTVAALKAAGCRTVWMGVESGSQKVLDAMDKDLALSAVHRAAQLLANYGINYCYFLQFGYPGEEAADIQATWQLVEATKPTDIGISVSYPLPNTPFYERVKDQLSDQDHWEDSGFMRPIFQATYPADFYPLLYAYFHQLHGRLRPAVPGIANLPRKLKNRIKHAHTKRQLARFDIPGIPFS